MTDTWPTELRIADQGRNLVVTLTSGHTHTLPAELLRVESPSAEVKGHGPGQETLVTGKAAVFIAGAEPVGNYAIRLKFSDGHSSGLYTWVYLDELGRRQAEVWGKYLGKVKAAGLSR